MVHIFDHLAACCEASPRRTAGGVGPYVIISCACRNGCSAGCDEKGIPTDSTCPFISDFLQRTATRPAAFLSFFRLPAFSAPVSAADAEEEARALPQAEASVAVRAQPEAALGAAVPADLVSAPDGWVLDYCSPDDFPGRLFSGRLFAGGGVGRFGFAAGGRLFCGGSTGRLVSGRLFSGRFCCGGGVGRVGGAADGRFGSAGAAGRWLFGRSLFGAAFVRSRLSRCTIQ